MRSRAARDADRLIRKLTPLTRLCRFHFLVRLRRPNGEQGAQGHRYAIHTAVETEITGCTNSEPIRDIIPPIHQSNPLITMPGPSG